MQNIIFWFRNDLRLHDNEAFLEASKAGNVIPVYVFDDRYFDKNFLGFKRTGAFRTKFLLEAVENLRKNLQEKGSDLIIRRGISEDIIAKIAKDTEAAAVYASKEVTQDETTIEASLSKILKPMNIEIELIWSATLFHARDLPFQINFIPATFAEFKKKIERSTPVRQTLESPGQLPVVDCIEPGNLPTYQELGFETAPLTDTRAAFQFAGGETEGLARLNEYIWEKDLLRTFKETRDGLLGADFSTKLSGWLSLGCISARTVYEEVKRFEADTANKESAYWLIILLLKRDFYHFSALKYGTRMFKASGIKNDLMKPWKRHRPTFDTWVKGETGIPFVDANMKEVSLTGYMSEMGRKAVARHLIQELGIDWTWGATYFESVLTDYDVCSNWGNWNLIADTGRDLLDDEISEVGNLAETTELQQAYIQLWLG